MKAIKLNLIINLPHNKFCSVISFLIDMSQAPLLYQNLQIQDIIINNLHRKNCLNEKVF